MPKELENHSKIHHSTSFYMQLTQLIGRSHKVEVVVDELEGEPDILAVVEGHVRQEYPGLLNNHQPLTFLDAKVSLFTPFFSP